MFLAAILLGGRRCLWKGDSREHSSLLINPLSVLHLQPDTDDALTEVKLTRTEHLNLLISTMWTCEWDYMQLCLYHVQYTAYNHVDDLLFLRSIPPNSPSGACCLPVSTFWAANAVVKRVWCLTPPLVESDFSSHLIDLMFVGLRRVEPSSRLVGERAWWLDTSSLVFLYLV